MTYNGYANYETWAVDLWLTNDQASEAELRRIVTEYPDTYEAAQALKELVEEAKPEVEGLYADLLNAAISGVNWTEIVESAKED